MVRAFLLLIGLIACISDTAFAETKVASMEARNKKSLEQDSSYEMISAESFWGDASFMQICAPKDVPLKESFVIYFEVLPSGELGEMLFEPLTETGECIKKYVENRTFPKPPMRYVSKIDLKFIK